MNEGRRPPAGRFQAHLQERKCRRTCEDETIFRYSLSFADNTCAGVKATCMRTMMQNCWAAMCPPSSPGGCGHGFDCQGRFWEQKIPALHAPEGGGSVGERQACCITCPFSASSSSSRKRAAFWNRYTALSLARARLIGVVIAADSKDHAHAPGTPCRHSCSRRRQSASFRSGPKERAWQWCQRFQCLRIARARKRPGAMMYAVELDPDACRSGHALQAMICKRRAACAVGVGVPPAALLRVQCPVGARHAAMQCSAHQTTQVRRC